MAATVFEIARRVYDATLIAPFRALYLLGPSVQTLGFWAGRPQEDVCAEVTGTAASFWATNKDECASIIETRFISWHTAICVIAYTVSLTRIFNAAITRTCDLIANKKRYVLVT